MPLAGIYAPCGYLCPLRVFIPLVGKKSRHGIFVTNNHELFMHCPAVERYFAHKGHKYQTVKKYSYLI